MKTIQEELNKANRYIDALEKKLDVNISRRDYFAGQALKGQISASYHLNGEEHAKIAYAIADAMMKESEK